MKNFLRTCCAPILNRFEAGNEAYDYKPLHRGALIFISSVFTLLAIGVAFLAQGKEDLAYFFPSVVFGLAGLLGLIVGLLGSERAVAKIWGSR